MQCRPSAPGELLNARPSKKQEEFIGSPNPYLLPFAFNKLVARFTMSEFVTWDLPDSPLYGLVSEHLSVAERIDLSHRRAKAIGVRYGEYIR